MNTQGNARCRNFVRTERAIAQFGSQGNEVCATTGLKASGSGIDRGEQSDWAGSFGFASVKIKNKMSCNVVDEGVPSEFRVNSLDDETNLRICSGVDRFGQHQACSVLIQSTAVRIRIAPDSRTP